MQINSTDTASLDFMHRLLQLPASPTSAQAFLTQPHWVRSTGQFISSLTECPPRFGLVNLFFAVAEILVSCDAQICRSKCADNFQNLDRLAKFSAELQSVLNSRTQTPVDQQNFNQSKASPVKKIIILILREFKAAVAEHRAGLQRDEGALLHSLLDTYICALPCAMPAFSSFATDQWDDDDDEIGDVADAASWERSLSYGDQLATLLDHPMVPGQLQSGLARIFSEDPVAASSFLDLVVFGLRLSKPHTYSTVLKSLPEKASTQLVSRVGDLISLSGLAESEMTLKSEDIARADLKLRLGESRVMLKLSQELVSQQLRRARSRMRKLSTQVENSARQIKTGPSSGAKAARQLQYDPGDSLNSNRKTDYIKNRLLQHLSGKFQGKLVGRGRPKKETQKVAKRLKQAEKRAKQLERDKEALEARNKSNFKRLVQLRKKLLQIDDANMPPENFAMDTDKVFDKIWDKEAGRNMRLTLRQSAGTGTKVGPEAPKASAGSDGSEDWAAVESPQKCTRGRRRPGGQEEPDEAERQVQEDPVEAQNDRSPGQQRREKKEPNETVSGRYIPVEAQTEEAAHTESDKYREM